MRRNHYVLKIMLAVLAVAIAGCGGGNSTTQGQPRTTGVKKRVLLSNALNAGSVVILDAEKDTFTTGVLGATGASKIVSSGGVTAVLNTLQARISVIDNKTEMVTFQPILTDQPVDVAISPDGKTAWAAERSFGFVQSIDTATGTTHPNILVPSVTRLVMSPNGTKLLAFSNDPQANVPPNGNAFFVIDTASGTARSITGPQLDQPFTGVFNASETQAFILNCGPGCNGTTASVVRVDFSGATPVFSASIPVAAATVGLLSGSNLYVAGTPVPALIGPGPACPLSQCGTLQIINTGTLTASPPVPITDGLHLNMALTSTNRLYIGSKGCTTAPGSAVNTVRGCLTIYNTATPGTKFPEELSLRQNFDVTGLQPISARNAIYVCQGGELDIFDTSLDALTPNQLDVMGTAVDVVQIDP